MKKMTIVVAAVLIATALVGWTVAQSAAPSSQPAQCRHHSPLEHLTAKLNLTTDQQAQAKAILDKAKADAASAADIQAGHKIFQDAWTNIRTNVLTDQQRTQLAQLHASHEGQGPDHKGWHHGPGRMFESLNLTPDQKAQVESIMDQARTDARNATDPQAKHQVFHAAFDKIKTTVLTPDQAKQLETEKAAHHKGPCGKEGKNAPATTPSQS